ncbi:MAG: outer membrane beta-barrel protein [Hyphomicrobiales bacterium]
MIRTAIILAAFAAALPFAAPDARAADMAENWPSVISHDREGPIGFGSGWYLRGDIGMSLYSDPDVSYSGTGMAMTGSNGKLDKTWAAGVGVGSRIGRWFRTDLTFDYHEATDYTAGGTSECATGATCSISAAARFSTYTLLLNGYVDLPAWQEITPYVGVGVGGSFVDWEDYAEVHRCVTGCTGIGRTAYSTDDRWKLAYAAMVGASIDVAPQIKIDAGYRFLGIGDGNIVDSRPGLQTARYESLYAHELRLGLRYEIE